MSRLKAINWRYRKVMNAMLYLLRGGLPWPVLPLGVLPPMSCQHYYYRWRDTGL